MKRLYVPIVVVLVLVLPAQASAATRDLVGDVDPSGAIAFQLKKKKGESTVKDFQFGQVPVSCSGGAGTTSGNLTFGMKVRRKKFGAKGDDGSGSNLRVEGKVKGKGKRAKGNIRLFGAVPLDNGTTGTSCDTGILSWDAARD